MQPSTDSNCNLCSFYQEDCAIFQTILKYQKLLRGTEMEINRQRLIIFMFFSILLFNLRTANACESKIDAYFLQSGKLKSSAQIKNQFNKCSRNDLLKIKTELKESLKQIMQEQSEVSRDIQRNKFQSNYYLLALLNNQI